jgi:hypothetical protein
MDVGSSSSAVQVTDARNGSIASAKADASIVATYDQTHP